MKKLHFFTCLILLMHQQLTAQEPVAPRKDQMLEKHGHQRNDPYYWMRERDTQPVLDYLHAENALNKAALEIVSYAQRLGGNVTVLATGSLSNDILRKLLKKNITTTFNAITCDGDTSTNDMATIFATGKVDNAQIKNINDKKIQNFDKALNKVLLNLAKRVVSDGEGSSKFVTVNVKKCKSEIEAKQIALSIANSPLVKTAIAGEDPNWGRIIMAIGKAGPKINLKKLLIKFGNLKIVQDGKLHQGYDETKASEYMKNENIDIDIEIFTGKKSFTVYTMDFTKKYIDINADYRS